MLPSCCHTNPADGVVHAYLNTTVQPQFNWTQQLNYMNYTVLLPNVVDLADYRRTLSQLVNITQGLVTGQPPWTSPGAPCNRPIPALNG